MDAVDRAVFALERILRAKQELAFKPAFLPALASNAAMTDAVEHARTRAPEIRPFASATTAFVFQTAL